MNGRYMARRDIGPGSQSGGSYKKEPRPLHIVPIVLFFNQVNQAQFLRFYYFVHLQLSLHHSYTRIV
jgi:hypothetical protein